MKTVAIINLKGGVAYILSIVLRQVFLKFFSKPVFLFPLQRVVRMS